MKNIIRQIDPQRLMIREGGGCLSIFGLPFLAAGIFLFLAAMKVVPFENADEVPEIAYGILLFMGVAFAAVGGGLLFGRTWKTIDLTAGCVRRVIGTVIPLLPRKTEQFLLQDYAAVVMRYDSGDSDTPETYPVFLSPKGPADELRLLTAGTYKEALEYARRLADFMTFPIQDVTSDHMRTLPPEGFKATVAERLRAATDMEPVAQPPQMTTQVTQGAGKTRMDIPGPGFNVLALIPLVFVVTVLWILGPAVLEFFNKTETPPAVQYVFIGFALFVGLVPNVTGLLFQLAGAKRNGTSVVLDQGEITIEERMGWKTKQTRIRLEDVLDVDFSTVTSMLESSRRETLQRASRRTAHSSTCMEQDYAQTGWYKWVKKLARSKGVIIKAQSGVYSFGQGLPEQEVQYLYGLVREALSSREQSVDAKNRT